MGDWPTQVWDAARTAGPFGTMLMLGLWWIEHKRAEGRQKLLDKLTGENGALEKVTTALTTAAASIDRCVESDTEAKGAMKELQNTLLNLLTRRHV